jgi:carbamoyl-phosphate synthase large subunit
VLPPHSLPKEIIQAITAQTKALAAELNVIGLMNIQFAVKDHLVYVLEVNPRASRTAPFVSKATGVPLAKVATKVMLGKSLEELGFTREVEPAHVSVKESVFPFVRFPGVDILLGPEMRSTGEVMGLGPSFGISYAKSQLAAGQMLPLSGTIFISVRDHDKPQVLAAAKKFAELGFDILATTGTANFLTGHGVPNRLVYKVSEGRRPNIIDRIKSGEISLVINTALGADTSEDAVAIRRTTLASNVPYATTVAAARALATGIAALREGRLYLKSLQEYHPERRLPQDRRLAEAL